jgi:hypothetical protein
MMLTSSQIVYLFSSGRLYECANHIDTRQSQKSVNNRHLRLSCGQHANSRRGARDRARRTKRLP